MHPAFPSPSPSPCPCPCPSHRERARHGARRLRRAARLLGRLAALGVAAFVGAIAVEVARLPDVRELIRRAPASTVLLDREGRPLRYLLTPQEELVLRVPLARIHPLLREATTAIEDARFRSHPGVDFFAVLRAVGSNVRHLRVVSGASTITMQVARLLRPCGRSLFAKFREAVLAVRLEMALGKDELLELYLNLAPYGGNARGVEAAARRYFGRGAGDLSLAEAALLAGLPQSPSRLRPDRHPQAARARRDRVLDRMEALGLITAARCGEAKAAAVRVQPAPSPHGAPHFVEWAARRVSPGETVRTSLDPALQAVAEEALRWQLAGLAASGVRSGAALVVESATGKVRALVGSGDFSDPRGGQVNAATARRSPGSLLKPFIYGLAFERGLAEPDTLLEDRPRTFRDGYRPRNFSRQHAGPVPAREALVRSLNVPAVDLLARLGVASVLERLRRFGLEGLRGGAERYGVALGVGGAEVSLLELVEAYTALSREGERVRLTFREEGRPGAAERVLSVQAARQVADVLQAAAWPPEERAAGLQVAPAAVKTGTSFGLRDAWAIAWTPLWTVGVWLGNPDGRPSPALVGGTAAAPVARAILRRLHPGGAGPEFVRPAAPERVDVASPAARTRSGTGTGIQPSLSTVDCQLSTSFRWILPADGARIVPHGRPGGGRLELRAEADPRLGAAPADPGARRPSRGPRDAGPDLAWFLDGAFVGRSRPGEALEVPLVPGTHRVTLVSPSGAEVRTVSVER